MSVDFEFVEEEDIDNSRKLTLEEAKARLEDLEEEITDTYNYLVLLRWKQGEVASNVKIEYGENTLEQLAESKSVHVNTLRESIRLYEHFNGNEDLFTEWLKEGKNNRRRWYECQNLIRSNSDPRVLGPDALKNRVIRRLEGIAKDIEKLNSLAQEEDSETDGVIEATIQEVRDYISYGNNFLDAKKITPRSKKYLDYIRSQQCIVSKTSPSEPHHLKIAGKGIKGSDFLAIPLQTKYHQEYHQIGIKSFEKKYNLNVREIALEYLHNFLTGQWAFQTLN